MCKRGLGYAPSENFKLGCSEIASEALVWPEYLAGVILPFTMIHISHHEALTLYMSSLRRWAPYRRLPSTSTILYFTLKLVQWSLIGKEVAKATMPNSLNVEHYASKYLQGGHVSCLLIFSSSCFCCMATGKRYCWFQLCLYTEAVHWSCTQ